MRMIALRWAAKNSQVPIPPCLKPEIAYDIEQVGLWRSLVARPSGGRKAAGSSPASPTNYKPAQTARTFGVRAFGV